MPDSPPAAATFELAGFVYREWKRYGRHLEEYGSELLGTAFMVFCVVGLVGFMFAPASCGPRLIPPVRVRLLITGLLLGGSGWLVALTPPGKLSGAHINPAVSIGFWVLRKMHFRDLLGYMAGQMAGGLIGAALGRAAFGRMALEVRLAALVPAPMAGPLATFAAEAGATFVLAFTIYTFVSHPSLMHWTPAAATLVVGVLVMVDGNYSGCGINPARWFGPAAVVGDWDYCLAYSIAPVLGALAAAALRRRGWFGNPVPHTGKLLHDQNYRSVFRKDRAPSTPPACARPR